MVSNILAPVRPTAAHYECDRYTGVERLSGRRELAERRVLDYGTAARLQGVKPGVETKTLSERKSS